MTKQKPDWAQLRNEAKSKAWDILAHVVNQEIAKAIQVSARDSQHEVRLTISARGAAASEPTHQGRWLSPVCAAIVQALAGGVKLKGQALANRCSTRYDVRFKERLRELREREIVGLDREGYFLQAGSSIARPASG